MNGNTLTVKAFAKINLFLQICGKRTDGYHNIKTLMQSVSLHDIITVVTNDSNKITLNTVGMKCDADNIIYKAAEAFFDRLKNNFGADITLKKHIPLASGMGGGSADAAAVLNALNILSGETISQNELCKIAEKVGADVPFCINGGTAFAEGTGELLKGIKLGRSFDVVIIKNFDKQSTGVMYQRADTLEKSVCESEIIVDYIEKGNYNKAFQLCRNDFLAVSDNRIEQQNIIDELYGYGAVLASLSGSGPSVFGLFENIPCGTLDLLKQKYDTVYLCKTCNSSFLID